MIAERIQSDMLALAEETKARCVSVSLHSADNRSRSFYSWHIHFTYAGEEHCVDASEFSVAVKEMKDIIGIDAETRELLLSL